MYKGEKVYLSGSNAAWSNYGYDFGNGLYNGTLEGWMADISAAGGNSFRKFYHFIILYVKWQLINYTSYHK